MRLLCASLVQAAYALPPGFAETPVGGAWNEVSGLAFSADGTRLFVVERGGTVWIVDNGVKLETPLLDISDAVGCEAQFRAAFLMGCVGAWSLHPSQIEIAKRVFSPDPAEVAFAKRVLEAMPDGRGVLMLDGKMQDDATWKQCKVMVSLAELLAKKDADLAKAYGF